LDALISDLSAHIDPPPARFDSPADQQKALNELNDLLVLLQKINYGHDDLKLMRRSAYVLQLGHMMGLQEATAELHPLFERMLAKFPKQADIETQYGLLWLQDGKWDKAEFYFNRAAKLGYAPALLLCALTHKEQNETNQALAKLAQYKKLQPDDPRIAPLERALRKK
jgi:tetratricopeptide (TPR) repeat protein